MEKPLWHFSGSDGSFTSAQARGVRSLYLPLCSEAPFMSSITPDLHGDAKTGNDTFLLEPVSRIDLSTSRASRNFWLIFPSGNAWSATGASKETAVSRTDTFRLEAGLLWQTIVRGNAALGIEARISSFVPAPDETLELMVVTLRNLTRRTLHVVPLAAIPLYCRSSATLRDHRHVSSLLMRTHRIPRGVLVTPTLLFNERGHTPNATTYFVSGTAHNGTLPEYIYTSQEEFCGEAGDLEAPEALKHRLPRREPAAQGKETMAGLRFPETALAAKTSVTFIISMGICPTHKAAREQSGRYRTRAQAGQALERTKRFWQEKSAYLRTQSGDAVFDNWLRWVTVQPTLRKIFGCSFLPDFDYGRGGRGWRDLWQDCLSLILSSPARVRPLLLNNFRGVRLDGSNATIIGSAPGEFIADRNNIPRVWMDHGIWPLITTNLYIHQTADLGILLEKTAYFKDRLVCRSREIDERYCPGDGTVQKDAAGRPALGTVLEHLLLESLVPFFNVGPHNHIRLEGADWNDGLDMAERNGESVAFTALYAHTLQTLAELIEKLSKPKIALAQELSALIDTAAGPLDYDCAAAKQKQLARYFASVRHAPSGKQRSFCPQLLCRDLRRKAEWIRAHIRKTEWLREGFYNGYYDNRTRRVEGRQDGRLRMTLTGQTFAVMSGVATDEQVRSIYAAARALLLDRENGGLRLNTDFGLPQQELGRAFSFVYGEKENGAVFSHMAVMFAYALYARGFCREGFETLDALYRKSADSGKSRIYPCLPEYFNAAGRGMYSYLTGSASWFILTLLTQAFGIRGHYGDLVVEPKIVPEQFAAPDNSITIEALFAGRQIGVTLRNPRRLAPGAYAIAAIALNGVPLENAAGAATVVIPRTQFLSLTRPNRLNRIDVLLD